MNCISKQVTWYVMSTDDVMLLLQSDITQRPMSSYKGLHHCYSFEGTVSPMGYNPKETFRGNKRGEKPMLLESSFQTTVG